MNSDDFSKYNTYVIEDSLRPDRDGLKKFVNENPQGKIHLKDRPTVQINYNVVGNKVEIVFREENRNRAIRNFVSEKLLPAVMEPLRECMAKATVPDSKPKNIAVGSR